MFSKNALTSLELQSIEEIKEFRHAGYTFYRKDLYDLEHIENWIDFINREVGCLC